MSGETRFEIQTLEDAPAKLASLMDIAEERMRTLEAVRAKNAADYNASAGTIEPMTELEIIVGDLWADGYPSPDILYPLRKLAAWGRAVGIKMTVATQHPGANILKA